MLNCRLISNTLLAVTVVTLPAAGQEMQPHRAVYTATMLEHGKPGGGPPGTYAFELKTTCDAYVIIQRMRLELEGPRGPLVSEQQSQMTESRDGKKLHFEHRSTVDGRQVSQFKGEATLDDDGRGQARYSEPEGQTVALPTGTMFPMALARATIRHAKAGDTSFDALFYYGEKVRAPQMVNVLIGRVPKRFADLQIPDGAEALVNGHTRLYYRGGFFDSQPKDKDKGEQAAFEMSSLLLDNGIELYGTHEEGDSGIEYRITRLESLPKPNCN
jgi:hypothetical protein